MSRPQKKGLDYFPHETGASADLKLEPLIYLYGGLGYAFYFLHLEYIYREGDFMLDVSASEAGGDNRRVLCGKLQIDGDKYCEILNKCLSKGLFDKDIYDKTGKLTSKGIMRRAGFVTDKRNAMKKSYGIKIVSAAETPPETIPETPLRAPEKEKESKEKKSKGEGGGLAPAPAKPYGEFKNIFLTDAEYESLTARFRDEAEINGAIGEMSVHCKAAGRAYGSYYARLLRWITENLAKQREPPPFKGGAARKGGAFIDKAHKNVDFDALFNDINADMI